MFLLSFVRYVYHVLSVVIDTANLTSTSFYTVVAEFIAVSPCRWPCILPRQTMVSLLRDVILLIEDISTNL